MWCSIRAILWLFLLWLFLNRVTELILIPTKRVLLNDEFSDPIGAMFGPYYSHVWAISIITFLLGFFEMVQPVAEKSCITDIEVPCMKDWTIEMILGLCSTNIGLCSTHLYFIISSKSLKWLNDFIVFQSLQKITR